VPRGRSSREAARGPHQGWRTSPPLLPSGLLVGPGVWLRHGLAQIRKVHGLFLYLLE
jgi:hypothetical protein